MRRRGWKASATSKAAGFIPQNSIHNGVSADYNGKGIGV